MADQTVESVARDLEPIVMRGIMHGAVSLALMPALARFVLAFAARREREALEKAAKKCERLFLDEFGKTHEPIACAEAIRRLAAEVRDEYTWPGGKRRALHQSEHEAWNATHYPGTRQICEACECSTGRCEEDAIYVNGEGPLCADCAQALEVRDAD